jgi:acyl carrier protein/nucleoside-diphosphate-sugar epimerase
MEKLGTACKTVLWTSSEQTSRPESAVDEVSDLWGAVRSITAVGSTNPASLWLVTTGAHVIEDHSADAHNLRLPSASQTALWGLARVIAREHPELCCISIDLSSHPGADELDLLQRLITSAASELQMAVRETKCYGLRLGRRTESDQSEVSLRNDGTYLITGGFGDLGLALAAFLADRGAGHIALVARRLPNDAALERLAQIESHGAKVHRFQADVANPSEIGSVLNKIRNGAAPLKGLFHLAGITQDTLLADFDRASLESVMRPKVFGSWNLHSLTANDDLDFFVMYSSVAAVFSQPGQGSYAAANAYLDGLAALRHASGLPGLSIQWGPWKDAGMIRESGANRSRLAWAEQGIGALNVETSLDGVHRLLARPVPVSFVGQVNWTQFVLGSSGKTPHLLSELFEPVPGAPQIESRISDQLASLPLTERTKRLGSHLKAIVAAVLKSKASRIDSSRRFGSLGVDSLMAVEIARRVTDTLGIRLPVTAIFNFPTLELLANEVARRVEPESPAAMPERAEAMESRKASSKPIIVMSAIAQMSEEEALQSLVKVAETK